jgi:hypothetical protein
MQLIKTTTKPFKAIIYLGLIKHYTDECISKTTVLNAIRTYQKAKLKHKKIALSVNVKDSTIVLADQVEPHLEISIINYPKFPLNDAVLKKEAEALTAYLMEKFEQNRVVIEFLDETVMFEKTDQLDPKVEKYTSNK